MKRTNYRWLICSMLFLATTINYMDRQVLSLTWKDFIRPEFHWEDADYGIIAAVFSLVYAFSNIFSGRFIDKLGTKKGYLWAIGIWSFGACIHALCGYATIHIEGADNIAAVHTLHVTSGFTIAFMTSVWLFLACRCILAFGESGNFPAAVKVTAEYFPKKDRAFATAIFNSGSTIGALIAPLVIPTLARIFKNMGVGNGWEMAFIIIGTLGFLWMGLWIFIYKSLSENNAVNQAEREYIQSADNEAADTALRRQETLRLRRTDGTEEGTIPMKQLLSLRQTWAIVIGKFLSDGVWWFFLFWTPAYISDVYGYTSDTPMAQMLIFTLYAITILSLYGGKLPTILINRTGKNAYTCRMNAMFIFALFPLLGLFAQTLGGISCWLTIIIIGIVGAAHQSWSANLYSIGSDLFPKRAIASITGLNGMAGGISSFLINIGTGYLLTSIANSQNTFSILSFQGKEAGYFLIFCYCSVAYLLAWIIMKLLVPKYEPVK